jgi:hypothetical protein
MLRDLTMIISVLVSVASLGFGVYKNIEANNAQGFAYTQAYRVMNVVKTANIGSVAKASILNAALGMLATPPPVIDLSQSNAATVEAPACSEALKATCIDLAQQLAAANTTHTQATQLKKTINDQNCFICFTQ